MKRAFVYPSSGSVFCARCVDATRLPELVIADDPLMRVDESQQYRSKLGAKREAEDRAARYAGAIVVEIDGSFS